MTAVPTRLPDNFDVSLVGDQSKLPAEALAALRELVWRRAKADPIWFLSNFWQCLNPETFRWEAFKLRDYQREDAKWIVDAIRTGKRKRKLIYKARQIGWTTLGAGIAFHDCFFTPNHPWLISSAKELDAQDTLLTKVKGPYSRLPLWFRTHPDAPKITDDNKERMSFDNESSILSVPATATAGRSRAVFGCLVDEWAFVENDVELLGALLPLTYGPMMVFSSANGMGNGFHSLWIESESHDSEWDARFHPWSVVPGRDAEWYARTQREFRAQPWLFFQEHPSTPEEGFAKSGRTVIPIDILRESGHLVPPKWRLDLGLMSRLDPLTKEGIEANAISHDAPEELWVWAVPTVERDERGRVVRKPNYVVGVDVAEGIGGDRTSFIVVNANNGEQVAAYRGYWPLDDLGLLIEWIGYSYHTALLLVERNNHGMVPLFVLAQRHYPRLFRMPQLAAIQSADRTPRYGFLTTPGSKPKLVSDLIKSIADDKFVIHDTRFLQEAQTFVADGKGGYAASPPSYDDHVMSHGLCWQGVLEVGAYPSLYYDDTPAPVTYTHLSLLKPKVVSGLDVGIGNSGKVERPNAFVL